jgi:hypothetical protein
MEGNLLYYKGMVGGFKRVYAHIDSSDFVTYAPAGKQSRKELLRIPLEPLSTNQTRQLTEVQPNSKAKDNQQFYLIRYSGPKAQGSKLSELKRFLFKADSFEENMLWIKCLNKYTQNLLEEATPAIVDQEELPLEPTKPKKKKRKVNVVDNQVNAFHSRLFVDDCDLNAKVEFINSIQTMLKKESADLVAIVEQD